MLPFFLVIFFFLQIAIPNNKLSFLFLLFLFVFFSFIATYHVKNIRGIILFGKNASSVSTICINSRLSIKEKRRKFNCLEKYIARLFERIDAFFELRECIEYLYAGDCKMLVSRDAHSEFVY